MKVTSRFHIFLSLFLGANFFVCLNCFTNSHNISEKIVRAVSGGNPFEASFPFFSCFSFLFFIFPIFPLFLFFLKNVFLFSFFSMYVPLLAFVSEFNKRFFLRGRCSMEVWCLLTT